jgi:hypothetical protein
MDSATLSAAAALGSSLIGAASTLAASWLTQGGQLRANALINESAKREALYAEFIIETSKRLAGAFGSHSQSPGVVAIP